MSALGQKQTFAPQKAMSALPHSDHESGHVPMVMSALPPKADRLKNPNENNARFFQKSLHRRAFCVLLAYGHNGA
jgi:hypothetical protein